MAPGPACFRKDKTLRILLTNDDGIHAPGLWEAAQALSQAGEVFVTAPDREQSGVGSSLTLHAPVKVRSVPVSAYLGADYTPSHEITAYAVEGTPGDSCLLGLEQLVKTVDLVVSGINTGSNLGWDIMVSGTVGAALQGFVRGFPTIAISVGSVQSPRFEGAARLLQLIAEQLSQQAVTPQFFLNINVPSLALEQINGVQVTRLGGRSYGESVRQEGTGNQQRYWISRNRPVQADNGEGTDMWALKNNRISITPLQLSLSNEEQMPAIESLLADLPAQLLKQQD
ncbi:MAG: 5'/3'-nucleotidase SurE [Dehalococcoidia bacterium]